MSHVRKIKVANQFGIKIPKENKIKNLPSRILIYITYYCFFNAENGAKLTVSSNGYTSKNHNWKIIKKTSSLNKKIKL